MNYWCEDVLLAENTWLNHQLYLQACDKAFNELKLITKLIPFTFDSPTIICVTRNEEDRLPIFLKHYKNIGVKNFHIIDNHSNDKTPEIAAKEPGVTLWQTQASYAKAAFGQLWVGAIARRFGLGKWIINVDADELLIYSEMESKSIYDFQQYLESHGYNRAFTPLIDLYTTCSHKKSESKKTTEQKLFFDGKPPTTYLFEDSKYGPQLIGGPRARMMGAIDTKTNPWLSKFCMAKWDSNTAYANIHAPYPFEQNPRPCFAALLHLKLLDDFSNRVTNAIRENQHYRNSVEYRAYQQWITQTENPMLIDEKISMPYSGPKSLVDAKIIMPIPWNKTAERE